MGGSRELVNYANHHFPLKGIVGMRFSDPTFSGATVRHLHAQIVILRMNSETKVPFQVPLDRNSSCIIVLKQQVPALERGGRDFF